MADDSGTGKTRENKKKRNRMKTEETGAALHDALVIPFKPEL